MRCLLIILILALFINLSVANKAFAYRPFVSTDAAVAEPKSAEFEIGIFSLSRAEGQNTFLMPSAVLNFGLIHRLELVGEFKVEKPPAEDLQIVDSALSLKTVLREGVLQGTTGISLGIETGLLLPSTLQGERRVGFEGVGILSDQLPPFTFHLNAGGGVDRSDSHPFLVWGWIGEFPLVPRLRWVGEVNGEAVETLPHQISGLSGFIWQSPWSNLLFDAGVRKGIRGGAPDWQITTGLTAYFKR